MTLVTKKEEEEKRCEEDERWMSWVRVGWLKALKIKLRVIGFCFYQLFYLVLLLPAYLSLRLESTPSGNFQLPSWVKNGEEFLKEHRF